MHFLDKRVNVICEELKKLKVKQKFAIDEWSYKEGNYIHPEDAEKDLTARTATTGSRLYTGCRRSLTVSGCGCMCAPRSTSGTTRRTRSFCFL